MARAPTLNYFVAGTCNTIDDRSGFKEKLSDTFTEWDGLQVAADMFEERNPQDFPVVPRGQRVFERSRAEPAFKIYTPPDPLKDF